MIDLLKNFITDHEGWFVLLVMFIFWSWMAFMAFRNPDNSVENQDKNKNDWPPMFG
jgi:putative Mn2+ efflux pump MntP